MHLELVELLRCPNEHAASVLVAAADVVENRYVVDGLLGCPECLAEYPVRGGVTHFANASSGDAQTTYNAAGDIDRDVAMRLAAQMNLSAGRTVFALIGYSVAMAEMMREIVAARMIVINDPSQLSQNGAELAANSLVAPFGVVTCSNVLPFVARKFDGIAFADNATSAEHLNQVVAALRPNGRLVSSIKTELPAGMRELVRDNKVWVAEKENQPSAPISLTRR